MAYRKTIFFLGLVLALGPTLVRYYLTWPLPGSQDLDSIGWAYGLGKVAPVTEVLGFLVALVGLVAVVRSRKSWKTLLWVGLICLVALGLHRVTVKYSAPAVFEPFELVEFARGTSEALPPETLVMGVASGGQAKAYPLRLLAYHHRLEDELDGEAIWVTYCSMCRTGKIFRPVVDDMQLDFDLVGAVRYNSIYRDRQTGSYWYQANGRGAAGPLEGKVLPELRADQMTLENWLLLHPESDVLQPDPAAADGYTMFRFDTIDEVRSDPEKPPEWQWVVGVAHDGEARGYPWSMLASRRLIQDQLGDLPLAIQLHSDGISQRAWDRRLDGRVLDLELDSETGNLVDSETGSAFGFDGVATDGELAGLSLRPLPASVEFRHSFESFSGAEIVEPEA
ncbi:MAG: DUF3179 domain-containing protein [bacterium]|nr:DUF3179 domain-containing protein [bacterium]